MTPLKAIEKAGKKRGFTGEVEEKCINNNNAQVCFRTCGPGGPGRQNEEQKQTGGRLDSHKNVLGASTGGT